MQAEYIDHMGDDLRVVNAARVSFDKESDWEYLNKDGEVISPKPNWTEDWDIGIDALLPEKDVKLLKYLANHDHWSPFSHVMVTMRETVPIFVARQRFKHMVGFTYNEVSRRYVDDEPKFFVPEYWRKAAENKKQGSSDEPIYEFTYEGGTFLISKQYQWVLDRCEEFYNDCIEAGVAPEQARMVLPQSMYTSYYVTGSLPAWSRAYKLRSDEHAQREIQDLAVEWNKVISNIEELKHSWKALIE